MEISPNVTVSSQDRVDRWESLITFSFPLRLLLYIHSPQVETVGFNLKGFNQQASSEIVTTNTYKQKIVLGKIKETIT